MSRLLRGYGIYYLRPPTSVGPGIAFHGPGVRLTDPFSQRDLGRRKPKSLLFHLPVLPTSTQFVADPVHVKLAPSSRQARKTEYQLVVPVVVDAAVGPLGGTAVQFAPPPTRARSKSRLAAPAVVVTPQIFVATPIAITLAPSARQGRKATYDLAGPFVINAPPRAKGRTATQFVQPPRIPTHSRLFPPAVTTAVVAATYSGPLVTLSPSRAGKAKPRLLPVPAAFQPFRPAIVSLSYAPTRAQAKSHLSAPTVVAPVLARRILVILAPQKRGAPKSILRAPAVVGPVLARPIDTTFARIRPVRTIWVLRKPTDLVDQQDLGTVKTHLAYSLRGRPKSHLSQPAVVAPVLARSIEVTLVRIRPVRTNWILRRPVDLVDRDDLGSVRVHLAYSVRGEPKSILRPPTVVAPVLARAILTTLVTIRPTRTIFILRRPTDLVDQADLGFVRVYLAPSFRGQPKSHLSSPTVVAPVLARPVLVHIAPSFRGIPKSRLSEPTVVAPVLARPIFTTFARILPVRTNPVLRRPVDLVDQQDLGFVRTHLVRIRPVRTVALLGAPVVIDLSPQTTFVTVTLAPSRFPTPKSILREPPKGTPQPAPIYPLFITLAPQSRGKAKPFLRATIYVAKSYAPVTVTLTPSRFPRPKSVLRKPTVVAPVLARAIQVELAPQFRGVAKPFLREIVYGARSYAPIRITLVASPRLARAAHSRLSAPTVVREFISQPTVVSLAPSHRPKIGFFITRTPLVRAAFVAAPVKVTLARIVTPKRFYLLSPPAVVGVGVTFRGLDVTLAYSRRGKPMYRLTLTRAQIIECFGVVVGTDFAATVCGTTSAATVQGVTSAATVEGTTSAATVEGTTSSRGTVSGGDTQREGCE